MKKLFGNKLLMAPPPAFLRMDLEYRNRKKALMFYLTLDSGFTLMLLEIQ